LTLSCSRTDASNPSTPIKHVASISKYKYNSVVGHSRPLCVRPHPTTEFSVRTESKLTQLETDPIDKPAL